MQFRFLVVAVTLAFASNAWPGPIYWSAQGCDPANSTVNPVIDGNPTDCVGYIDREPGGANDSEAVLNTTPIFDRFNPDTNSELFTGFFGYDDWDFAQKRRLVRKYKRLARHKTRAWRYLDELKAQNPKNHGGSLTSDIDLGLALTDAGGGLWDWAITDGAFGAYENAIAVIKQAQGFDSYLLGNHLGAVSGSFFMSDWGHFSIYVRGDYYQVPEPGTLSLLGACLIGLAWRTRTT